MKKYTLSLTAISFVAFSFAWFSNMNIINPDLSFTAGGPEEYLIYEITCEDNSVNHSVREVDTVGTDGFVANNLQLGKINNLGSLGNSNYIYYAVRIPKNDGATVSLGVSYGDTDTDGNHFCIYVPIKDENGDIEYLDDGSVSTRPLDDHTTIDSIEDIETNNDSTFLVYSVILSTTAPDEYTNIEELDTLFNDSQIYSMDSFENDGAPEKNIFEIDLSTAQGDYYYAYIKLTPNISLYSHFIDYLWRDMPFFLAYEIRAVLDVTN